MNRISFFGVSFFVALYYAILAAVLAGVNVHLASELNEARARATQLEAQARCAAGPPPTTTGTVCELAAPGDAPAHERWEIVPGRITLSGGSGAVFVQCGLAR